MEKKIKDGNEKKANLAPQKKISKNIKKGEEKVIVSKSNKVFYGDSTQVNPLGWLDYNDLVKLEGKNKQKLVGFDPKYNDFVHYILGITHEIWEEKGLGVIYDTYSNNIAIHTSSGTSYGVSGVITSTLQNIHMFPDRKLVGQNVVWSENTDGSFFSSHRILNIATNHGDNSYGKATGKKVAYRAIADCMAINNRIFEEWVLRDNLWIVKQLGYDPHEVAKKLATVTKNAGPALQSKFGIGESMEGQFYPELYKAKDDSVGEMVLQMVSEIWGYKLINKVKDYYHDNAVNHFICNMDLNGYDEIQGMFVSLFASFPNAAIEVDRVTCNGRGAENSWDVAVRWRINGVHEGYGYFGDPSGNRIEIMGINHYHIIDNKVKEEWVLFDGLEVLRQIYLGEV
ncbi:ester cyclase [Clostridium sediminicola]|uniref:nuclear transport factor 2 family protein n=1 Tax=Clostridium sediminicola TaxID=3114879 RepID=UPI0031F23790